MRNVSVILLTCSAVSLGGCIILYGPGDHDEEPASSSSSGGGGSACTTICGEENHCSPSTCLAGVWGRRFNVSANQSVASVAVTKDGTTAITGTFNDTSFPLDTFPLANNSGGHEGYSALFDRLAGKVVGANVTIALGGKPPRDGRGIAIFDDSLWLAGIYTTALNDQNLGLVRYDRMDASMVQTFQIGRENADDVIAIVGDDPDVYVIGKVSAGAMPDSFSCAGATIPNQNGIIVVKFGKQGTCQWFKMFTGVEAEPAAIGAAMSTTHGVWFTGTFRESIVAADASIELKASQSVSTEAFLIGVQADGSISAAQSLGPGVVPSSLTVDPKDGRIYVAGQLFGSTKLKMDLATNETAAFVVAFEKNVLETHKWVTAYTGSTTIGGGAKATAVTVDGTSVYVAGVFGFGLEIPREKGSEPVKRSDANPFVARLSLSDGLTLAFHDFAGGGESFDLAAPVHMSKTPTGVTIAGAWSRDLNFTTLDGATVKLPGAGNFGNTDVFVVRLDSVPVMP